MKDFAKLLSLPATLLALTIAQCAEALEAQWPYNLPRHAKYYPEDEPHVKRGLGAQELLQWHAPQGVKKMGDDPGEKFFLDYWEFEEQSAAHSATSLNISGLRRTVVYDETTRYDNDTATCMLHAPFRGQTTDERSPFFHLFRRSLLMRDFQCPTGTTSCSNIGSDLCCQSSETCVNTNDGVGCCPNGGSCGQEVAACDTSAGYSSCPNSKNGGCCLPGFECLDTGCVFYGTQTVIATASPATVTTGTVNPTTVTEQPAQGTTVVVAGEGSTTTVTITDQGSTVTTTPASGTDSCPTGFYMCSAVYLGGCCRVDRNCDTTSCPSSDSTAVVTSGLTIQAGAGSTGSCASAWSSCAADVGGGCCPPGFACGTQCTATNGGQTTTKVVASAGAVVNVDRYGWSFLGFGVLVGMGMVWL
ncbi:hypothetical protein DOTSEDRAFT_173192 [Dothistroma septosporum NZE10]|uniref:GPI anchored protein n=1 Tax=Dothistroma septosporum (strain NZE10 / CBS 128990) TaxID=675120 RepID=N1PN39_DOTSN|nr:hypothetical protein DOTSEDRAFT_173192 [Dothistroma septosporum NZE10]